MNQEFSSPSEALEHAGVKGMKWGVRKKQAAAAVKKAPGAAKKGAGKALDTAIAYNQAKADAQFRAFFNPYIKTAGGDRAALTLAAMGAGEKAAQAAGKAAIKRINTEVKVSQLKREMRGM